MLSDQKIYDYVIPMKDKDKDDKDKDKHNYTPPKEFRTIFKGSYKQPLKRMWRIIYDDGKLPMEERETFLEEYTLIGKSDFKCTEWISPDGTEKADCYHPDNIKVGWKRNISYIMDINSPIGPKQTRTSAEEEMRVYEPKKIIFQSTSSTPDVPYGSSFNTIIIQCLYEDEKTQETTFEVYGYILWTGSCIIKKSIEKFAFNGMIDHQKEMDEALNEYIEQNPNPKYTEDLITFSPRLSYTVASEQSYSTLENDKLHLPELSIPIDVDVDDDDDDDLESSESTDHLLQDLSHNKDMTTLNNNLVYDNILEIKEKELEKNRYGTRVYCSSLANTFNSSYVNISERSLFEEKMKLKEKPSSILVRIIKWWLFSFILTLLVMGFTYIQFFINEQIQ